MFRSLLTLLLLLTITTNANAEARRFRINSDSFARGAYAIGWGVANENLDFEAIDATNTDEWVDKNIGRVQNYLVNVETNQILSLIGGDGTNVEWVNFKLGGRNYGNHFSISLLDLGDFQSDASPNLGLVGQVNNQKWYNQLQNVFLIDEEKTIIAKSENSQNEIDSALLLKLNPAQKKKFSEYGSKDYSFKAHQTNGKSFLDFTLEASIPKEDTPHPLLLRGSFEIQQVATKLVFKLVSLKEGR